MLTTKESLVGRWVLNPSRSEFDVNHRPRAATLVIERDAEGHYSINAEGIDEKGEPCKERPQTVIPDGQPRPVPDFSGLTTVTTRPDDNTMHTDVKREDGSIAGQATFVVSVDGRSLTAINSGFDSQLRQFKQQTVWDRQVPEGTGG
jgi:hypothetical protein